MQQSRSLCGFSDFPIPSDQEEIFLHNTEVLKYLERYANEFQLQKFIRYNANIIQITRSSTWVESAQWKIELIM